MGALSSDALIPIPVLLDTARSFQVHGFLVHYASIRVERATHGYRMTGHMGCATDLIVDRVVEWRIGMITGAHFCCICLFSVGF